MTLVESTCVDFVGLSDYRFCYFVLMAFMSSLQRFIWVSVQLSSIFFMFTSGIYSGDCFYSLHREISDLFSIIFVPVVSLVRVLLSWFMSSGVMCRSFPVSGCYSVSWECVSNDVCVISCQCLFSGNMTVWN